MHSTASQQRLSQLLQNELVHTRQLLAILVEEYEALRKPSAEQITDISKKKLACLQEFERHTSARGRFLAEQGRPPTKAATEDLVRSCPQDSPIHDQWLELQSLAEQAQEQNEINGGIITLSQKHTRMALDILSGKDLTSDTYGPGGASRSDAAPHTLAKA